MTTHERNGLSTILSHMTTLVAFVAEGIGAAQMEMIS